VPLLCLTIYEEAGVRRKTFYGVFYLLETNPKELFAHIGGIDPTV
jgi:hypothetical protein